MIMASQTSNRIRTLLLNRPVIRTSIIGCNPIIRPSEVAIPEHILSSIIQGGDIMATRSAQMSTIGPIHISFLPKTRRYFIFTPKTHKWLTAKLFLSLITTLNQRYQHKYKPVKYPQRRKYNTRRASLLRSNIGCYKYKQ